jgi:hypothetical protein
MLGSDAPGLTADSTHQAPLTCSRRRPTRAPSKGRGREPHADPIQPPVAGPTQYQNQTHPPPNRRGNAYTGPQRSAQINGSSALMRAALQCSSLTAGWCQQIDMLVTREIQLCMAWCSDRMSFECPRNERRLTAHALWAMQGWRRTQQVQGAWPHAESTAATSQHARR